VAVDSLNWRADVPAPTSLISLVTKIKNFEVMNS
jgi:hypothetical protein